jgi:hypothetical protein
MWSLGTVGGEHLGKHICNGITSKTLKSLSIFSSTFAFSSILLLIVQCYTNNQQSF